MPPPLEESGFEVTRHQELTATHVFSQAPGLTGSGYWQATSIVVDSNGNSYVFGDFSDDSSLTFGCSGSLSNPQHTQRDVFLVKLDDTGDCVWQLSVGDGASSQNSISTSYTAADMTITPNDTVVIAINQYFIPFGMGSYSRSMGILEFNSSGGFLWGDAFTAFDDTNKSFVALASGDDDALVAVGFHDTDFSFAGSSLPDPATNGDGDEVFVLAWEPRSGSSRGEDWAHSFGGTGGNYPADVAIDQDNGDIAVVGNYDDEHNDVDLNAGNTTTTNAVFVQTLESDGTHIASLTSNMDPPTIGPPYIPSYGYATATTFDVDSELYVAGYFDGVILKAGGLDPPAFGCCLDFQSDEEDWFVVRYDASDLSSIASANHSNIVTGVDRERINAISAPLNNTLIIAGEACDSAECVPSGFVHLLGGSLEGPDDDFEDHLITYSSETFRFNDVFATFESNELHTYVVGRAKGTSIDIGGGTLTGGHDLVACYEIDP